MSLSAMKIESRRNNPISTIGYLGDKTINSNARTLKEELITCARDMDMHTHHHTIANSTMKEDKGKENHKIPLLIK